MEKTSDFLYPFVIVCVATSVLLLYVMKKGGGHSNKAIKRKTFYIFENLDNNRGLCSLKRDVRFSV